MTATRTILSLFFILSGATPDEYHLARAIEGEGALLVDPSVGYAIGRSVLNRLGAEWCASVRECVDGAYWGAATVRIPSQWSLDIAHDVLTRPDDPDLCGRDRAWCFDAFYVFSLPDRHKLDIADEHVLAVVLNPSGQAGFVFCDRFTEWGE